MKTIFTIFSFLFLGSNTFGQMSYFIDFDSPFSENSHIIIDTASNMDNIWQIGVPGKNKFNAAYSLTHAIVTDTLNPYPVNDTSSFILKHIRPGQIGGNTSLQLNFWFKMNTDTLVDFGQIEASVNNGVSWINLMTEDTTYNLQWIEPKPVLSGTSNDWQHFSLELNMLTYELGYSDTLLYRFTFISDSIQTNKDGWMLDDFQLDDIWEGIDEYDYSNMIIVYPNPTKGEISILENNEKIKDYNLEIIDINGNMVFKNEIHVNNLTLNLPNGLYFMKIFNKRKSYLKKLIINE